MFDLNLIDEEGHYLIELIGDLDIYNNKKFMRIVVWCSWKFPRINPCMYLNG